MDCGTKQLRLLHVIVQPVLVWDNGAELIPFEHQISSIQVPLSKLPELVNLIPADVKLFEQQFQSKEEKQLEEHLCDGKAE